MVVVRTGRTTMAVRCWGFTHRGIRLCAHPCPDSHMFLWRITEPVTGCNFGGGNRLTLVEAARAAREIIDFKGVEDTKAAIKEVLEEIDNAEGTTEAPMFIFIK